MTFESLASSSKGNAYILTAGEQVLLLECGLPIRTLQQRLGRPVSDLSACFITHEHKDHSRCATGLLRRGVPVYGSEGTARALGLEEMELVEIGLPVRLGSVQVMSFPVWHDAKEPVGYLIEEINTGERLLFATDTRGLPYVVPRLRYIAVECNYDKRLLERQDRLPDSLKARIAHNHFEVEDVIRWLRKQDLSGVLTIYLLHLSDSNSREYVWRDRFCQEFPGIDIVICEE